MAEGGDVWCIRKLYRAQKLGSDGVWGGLNLKYKPTHIEVYFILNIFVMLLLELTC